MIDVNNVHQDSFPLLPELPDVLVVDVVEKPILQELPVNYVQRDLTLQKMVNVNDVQS